MSFKRAIEQLLNIGITDQKPNSADKIKLMNIITLFTFIASALYTLNYLFILEQPLVAAINTFFSIAYLSVFAFNLLELTKAAKTSFFVWLMIHIVVCTNVYVTKDTGFHLYFFLVPTGAFLLYRTWNNETILRCTASRPK